jgi:8-oxo-dGTP pyrophosphatase MutT (NUDIX family)
MGDCNPEAHVKGSSGESWIALIRNSDSAIFRRSSIEIGMAQKYEVIIEAAGGLLTNSQGQLLCIHRLGYWDLPKGKIERGESIEEAAVREVSEECGVPFPVIKGALETTEHFYTEPQTGRLVLKRTHWFAMAEGKSGADAAEALTPQIEEGITQAVWADCSQVRAMIPKAYDNIAQLMAAWVANACPGLEGADGALVSDS